MKTIDTTFWKEFKVSDLFDVIRGTSRKMQSLNDGNVPVIAAARNNQGVAGYYDVSSEYEDAFTVSCNGVGCGSVFYHDYPFAITGDASVLISKCNIPEDTLLYVATLLDTYFSNKYSYTDKCSPDKIKEEVILLPVKDEYEPDWDYMESYMKAVMEESEKSLENLKKADDAKHLIDVSGWGEFKLSDLFIKKTMKGYPKKVESYEEVENGYHIYGQNIGWQYPYKVLMDEQYLHKVEPDKPILAYTSSVGEIGLINESFYRSGDNGAFQGLFPIGYHPNLLQMQFVLSILKKEFKVFRYDTSMQNTMDITFKLPITPTGEPDWRYMEDYMKKITEEIEYTIENL